MGTIMFESTKAEQDQTTIEELRALGYDYFKDTNNILKVTDIYGEELPCAILGNSSEQKT